MFRISSTTFVDSLTLEDLPLLAQAHGAAVVLREGVRTVGVTPPVDALGGIVRWLQQGGHDAYSAGGFFEEGSNLAGAVPTGILAVAISRDLGEYLLWFGRPVSAEQPFRPWNAAELETAVGVRVAILEKARRHAVTELDRLREEQKRLDEFFAAVGHELRNSMTAIGGWVALLQGGARDAEQQRRALDIIEKNVQIQRKVVDDLVDASKLTRRQMKLELRDIEVAAFVEDILAASAPSITARELTLKRAIDDGLGVIHGDSERLRQVFANLLGNAVKFTPPGGTIEMRARRTETRVEFSVTDSGAGISQDFLPHVFEAFRQAGPTHDLRRSGGLGLGLTIAKHLVDLHGGQLIAESPGPGLGATFRVLLPAAHEPLPKTRAES